VSDWPPSILSIAHEEKSNQHPMQNGMNEQLTGMMGFRQTERRVFALSTMPRIALAELMQVSFDVASPEAKTLWILMRAKRAIECARIVLMESVVSKRPGGGGRDWMNRSTLRHNERNEA
jgi:hypothetical protein